MAYIAKTKIGSNTYPIGSCLYGTCSTAAETAAKVVTMADFDTLITGVEIQVKFDNANTASTPTLNVGGTGAKNIFYRGAQITTSDTKSLLAGVCTFVYDGTQWCLTGGQEVGGGGTMWVTFTKSGNTYSADKTNAEVKAAIAAGKSVYGIYNSDVLQLYYYTTISSTGVSFYNFVSNSGCIITKVYTINSNNTVTVSSYMNNSATPRSDLPFIYQFEILYDQTQNKYVIYTCNVQDVKDIMDWTGFDIICCAKLYPVGFDTNSEPDHYYNDVEWFYFDNCDFTADPYDDYGEGVARLYFKNLDNTKKLTIQDSYAAFNNFEDATVTVTTTNQYSTVVLDASDVNSSFTNNGHNLSARISKYNHMVTLSGNLVTGSSITANSYIAMFRIPAGFKPKSQLFFKAYKQGTATEVTWYMDSVDNDWVRLLSANTMQSGSEYRFTVSYCT